MSDPPDDGSQLGGDPRGAPPPETDASEDADVHAFLIADVRGYTAFTQERGDEGAARLAGRFAEVVRGVVEEHRGRVVELRGDEALVVFGSPRSAMRAAVALQHRFVEETIADPSLPLTVGIGLDAGEAVPVEGGYRGGALNVAARLCSQARAGEVIASREIVHLARRVDGVRFTERGQAQLKGLDQPVHMVAVRSEHQDAAQAIAPFVRSTAPPPTHHRRRKVIAGAVAFAVLAALVAVPLTRRGGSSQIAPSSIGILDSESGDVKWTLPLGENARPGLIASSADDVWVTNPDTGTVTRILSNERDVRDPIDVGENPTGIAAEGNIVWVVESGEPSVSRINTETRRVEGDAIPVGNGPAGIAVGEGGVWVTNRFDGSVSRIDPSSGEVVKTIPVGLDPRGIATGFDSAWVALAGSNTVVRIDPITNEVTQSIPVGNAPGSVAVNERAVWVVNTLGDTVSRISPETNTVVDVIQVGNSPSGIAVAGGALWVANEADGTLSRIEPGQTPSETSVRQIVIGSIPQGLTEVKGDLWVSVRGTSTSHAGGTLQLVSFYGPSTLDPAVAWGGREWMLLRLLGDGLVAFEPTGGTNPTLVPDLATSLPTPTADGRKYTFQLGSGIEYSSGEEVTAADFRKAFERGFQLQTEGFGGPYTTYFSGLVGGKACADEPSTCDLSDGIVTDDASGTVTFNLVAPDPEFPFKLTMPFAYPVPPSVHDEEQVTAGIPGTGPYTLDEPMTDEGLALVRNRHFGGASPAQPDAYVNRIEWTFGVKAQTQVETVAAGKADFALDAGDLELESISVPYASQVHTSPSPATYFVVLNTEAPPFDHVEVRRAINFAIDRERALRLLEYGEAPTCQQIPPNFPGYEPYCPYTKAPGPVWTAPDLEEARRLVDDSGTFGAKVVFEYPTKWWHRGPELPLADYIVELLEDLGYEASAQPLPKARFDSPDNEFQMAVEAWGADYPAASNFIVPSFACDSPKLAPFCDRGIDAMIKDAIQGQTDDQASAGKLWAAVDHAIVDLAPYIWLGNGLAIDFVSERVGNYQHNPQWGVLLNQLWVQ